MPSQRYDLQRGQFEETHIVVTGESLSRIASHYPRIDADNLRANNRCMVGTEAVRTSDVHELRCCRNGGRAEQHKNVNGHVTTAQVIFLRPK